MPRKNTVRQYDVHSYYHVYNRGVEKRKIFLDDQDYVYFMYLLKRYLSSEKVMDKSGRPYPNYHESVRLVAFCLMPNHFHMLLYQLDDTKGIETFMKSLTGSYTRYFNKKHKRIGHLFEGVYKASHINTDSYILHITRYIHMNPRNYEAWPYSSWPYYVDGWQADWVHQHDIFQMFEGGDYRKFVRDYEVRKEESKELSHVRADS